jgi:hypothetical protein
MQDMNLGNRLKIGLMAYSKPVNLLSFLKCPRQPFHLFHAHLHYPQLDCYIFLYARPCRGVSRWRSKNLFPKGKLVQNRRLSDRTARKHAVHRQKPMGQCARVGLLNEDSCRQHLEQGEKMGQAILAGQNIFLEGKNAATTPWET